MKKMMSYSLTAGLILVFLSAMRYDYCLYNEVKATSPVFVPAILGTALIVLWLNKKPVEKYLKRVRRNFAVVMAEARAEKAEYTSKCFKTT